MTVSSIALCASPPSSVCSTAHPYHINPHASYDLDFVSRSPPPPGPSGLTCLLSSPTTTTMRPISSSSSSFIGGEEIGCLSELKELSGSFSWRRDHSPVSVLNGPVSCSVSRSMPVRIGGDSGLFDGFVRNSLGSCLDYNSYGSSSAIADELTFSLEDSFVGVTFEEYARELLLGAQLKHKIFCEEFVIKAFCEAEKAHRGQVNKSNYKTWLIFY